MGNGVNIVRTIVGLKPKIPLDEQLRNACFFGQRDVADEIIAQIPRGPGGLVDGMDPIGYTPIMYAAGSGYPEILEALLQHGADINHQAQNGLTAMHKAAEAGKVMYRSSFVLSCTLLYPYVISFPSLFRSPPDKMFTYSPHVASRYKYSESRWLHSRDVRLFGKERSFSQGAHRK